MSVAVERITPADLSAFLAWLRHEYQPRRITGNTAPTSTGWLAFQASAANSKSVRIRITGLFSAADEKYFLDALQVRGMPAA